jgi:hypothetical protein
VASIRETLTVFWPGSSVIITVTVFGSILFGSPSATFSLTSPVASSKPYEALTGLEITLLLARTSTRTVGASSPNRLDWA